MIGGNIVSHWRPQEFSNVLTSLAQGNHGYWYLSFNDFSKTHPNPPALHAKGELYWSAVDNAHQRLTK